MQFKLLGYYHRSCYTNERMSWMHSSCLALTTEVKVWALETLVPETFYSTLASITGYAPVNFTLAVASGSSRCCRVGFRFWATTSLDD